jgi:PHP family Zn ribbon phosphoesterase
MKFIGDFHIHSHYSLATSKELRPEFLDYWTRLKGIKVAGTGDFTHPGWIQELKEQLEPAEEGLFKLKQENKKKISLPVEGDPSFILTAEISNIYKKKGKVRKVHNVVFAPSFNVVEKIQNKLAALGLTLLLMADR